MMEKGILNCLVMILPGMPEMKVASTISPKTNKSKFLITLKGPVIVMLGLYDTRKNYKEIKNLLVFVLCIIAAVVGFLIGLEL